MDLWLPEPQVPRPRLLAVLDNVGCGNVVLVCAPAGFGKTALLARWVRSAAGATAWADVHPTEHDPGRPWSAILASLTACREVPPDSSLHRLGRAASASWAEPGFVPDVVAALEALPVRVTLVLHDVHEVVAPVALKSLESLVAARPGRVRLVVCSRWDSLPSLNRLRAEGRLHEIRDNQLRFTVNETGALLHRLGLPLTPAHVIEIHAGTRGWPTGVRLTGAALRTGMNPQQFLERLAANECPLADFLIGEVLAALPTADRDVLSAISSADPATVEQATALTGRPDAGAVLARLARDTGLVARVRVPANSYQVHPMATAQLGAANADEPAAVALPCLGDVERQVLALLPSSLSVEEIGGELHIPTIELEARMRTIYRKLGASSRRTAAAAAYEGGLLR
jgi:LuxR family maltose regulon positive regulatory protein